jgi:CBS domain-containing protein
MRLVELLDARRVVVPLAARTLTEAAHELVDAMDRAGAVSDVSALHERVGPAVPREALLTGPALLLHYRTEAVSRVLAAVGVSPTPLKREEESEKAARILVLLASPPKESANHLLAVSAFARALSRREVVDAFLNAGNAEQVITAAPIKDIQLPAQLTVRDVMVPRQLSVRPDVTLGEACRLMLAHDVAALPVVSDSEEVLGMVTHQELVQYLLPLQVKRVSTGEFRVSRRRAVDAVEPHELPVREVMDRTVLCVSEDQSLAEVATMMLQRNVDRFPVAREGRLVGFLTRGDIVRRLLAR